jgi:hypothetical protein
LAAEGFPSDSYVNISTKIKGDVESSVQSNSINGLLETAKKTIRSGDPDYLGNLSLYISHWTRSVSIRIEADWKVFGDGVNVTVDGDEEWVRGRSGVLKEVLAGTQSPLLYGRGRTRGITAFAGFIAGETLGAVLSYPNASIGSYFLISLSLDAALAGGGYFFARLLDRKMCTKLVLAQSSKRKIDAIALASLGVAIVGVIVAVVAIVIAHADAVSGS